MAFTKGVDGLRYWDVPPAKDNNQEYYRIDADGNRQLIIETTQEDDKVLYYGNRNRRIQNEAALIAARTSAVEAQAEGFKQHYDEQAKLGDLPYDGLKKVSETIN